VSIVTDTTNGPNTPPAAAPAPTISDLRVEHRRPGGHRFVAVNGVDLVVRRGEVVGLIGESGSGKTSVALASSGLGKITSGDVRIEGIASVTSMSRSERARVQNVFQDPHASLDPRQRIGAGMKELRNLHPEESAWISDIDLMARVNLPADILQRYPHEVSGGQIQRVCIARALLLRPALLIADEPTSALDVSVQAQVLGLISSLRETGIGVLFVSHDFAVVRAICDRTYVMYKGEIVEHGVTSEILGNAQHPYTQRLLASVPRYSSAE
jgi:ABC-type glutathione transport system ATPase component